jgi:hypothetical protein
MLKKSFSILALTLSFGLSSLGFSEEPVKVETVAEAQEVPMHINQKNLDTLVSGLLKDSGKNWRMRTKLEGKKVDGKRAPSVTYVYSTEEDQGESFAAFVGAPDKDFFKRSDESIQATMQKLYPGAKMIDFKVIQRDADSMMIEWTTENISDPDQKAHTWVRSVNSDEGLILLQYTTEDMSKVADSRKVWQPLLEHVAINDKPQQKVN